ncbi:MAG: oligosaccharide flippase family protein, partial [Candidatus Thermoplasmatota archaeon]|nr:oligosaccharide flippase family protein [Candidatus Thermoplasmatota archaeon]
LSGFGWQSRRSGHEARTIFSYSLPVMLSGLVSFGSSNADKFIVAGLLSLSLLGIYNFSLLFGGALTLIVMPFTNVLLPKMSSLFSANKQVELRDIKSRVNYSFCCSGANSTAFGGRFSQSYKSACG